jgi:hypothetical protein
VALFFKDEECGSFAGFFSAHLVGSGFKVLQFSLRVVGCDPSRFAANLIEVYIKLLFVLPLASATPAPI